MTGILFDLDGTLLDTLDDLHNSVNYALAQFGYPLRTREEIRCFVGNGAANLIQRSVPQGADWEPVFRAFQSHYPANCRIRTGPYPGILQMLAEVAKHHPVAIVSNKPDVATKALCADFFPGVYALGQIDGCPRKPAPDMLYRAMEQIGADSCIYIGDSEVDIETAANANAPCISVLWGFRSRETLTQAGGTVFCQRVEDLPGCIETLL